MPRKKETKKKQTKVKKQEVVEKEVKTVDSELAQTIQKILDKAKQVSKAEDVPIIKIVEEILTSGYMHKASDIHIEPYEEDTLIRFRVDGILHDMVTIPKSLHNLIVTRIKILSRLRTDEHRAAQDGKLRFKVEDTKVDARVSIVPIVYGEKAVLRLLSERSRQHDLENLGFEQKEFERIMSSIIKPWGMILATGPTGSGKTTTLYGVLKKLNRREVNISTIEDPVEYDIEGVNQIQVNSKTNLTFAAGLRSIVRQDPDIVMVGEIRDEETARIAINSAMTGHLVLSTLHTNDAPTTLPRLLDMGIQPFLVSSTINLIIAQRLVRKICGKCRVKTKLDKESYALLSKQVSKNLLAKYGLSRVGATIYKGKGCVECQTGYSGRIGIFEILEMTDGIKTLVMQKANAEIIKQKAVEQGMVTMIDRGLQKVIAGQTTIEEILRVAKE
jgi:type IV pilus assembly protein PilB